MLDISIYMYPDPAKYEMKKEKNHKMWDVTVILIKWAYIAVELPDRFIPISHVGISI